MIKISTRVGKFIELEQSVIGAVNELTMAWGGSTANYKQARFLLGELFKLDLEMVEIVKESPVMSLHNAPFGWASYEVRNAQINLVFLIQFGTNHATADEDFYTKNVRPLK